MMYAKGDQIALCSTNIFGLVLCWTFHICGEGSNVLQQQQPR